ncbi:MAG TPA: hypothetical protein VL403_17065 [Candidatus Kryptonia bacterium]|nr:hypothetical protein [Candidatus Kryptonia bacterium]
MTIRSMMLTAALLFVAFVAHAAYRESTTCPVVGKCASIHLQLLKDADWSPHWRPGDSRTSTVDSRFSIASH